jgi:hypothetical protein
MKNIFLTFLLVVLGISMSAQVKVFNNGRTFVGDNSATTNPLGVLQVNKPLDDRYYAIYTDSPSTVTTMTGTFSSLYLVNSDQTNNNYSRFNFGDGSNGAGAAIGSRMFDHAGNRATMEFWTRGSTGGLKNRMSIANDGKVMVGTGTPTELLSVNGDAAKVGGGTWATFSDKKLKKDVKSFEDGLEEVLRIEPVWFKYNGKAGISNTEKAHVGIIAQEMAKIAPYTVKQVEVTTYPQIELKNADGDVTIEDDYDNPIKDQVLTFDPNAITYMLVNAVKEQQDIIDMQNEKLRNLESKVNDLISILGDRAINEVKIDLPSQTSQILQNEPNPFNGTTRIKYNIPSNVQNAEIVVFDVAGKLIRTLSIDDRGAGDVDLTLNTDINTTLFYQLITDGQKSETFKMLHVK